MLHDHDERWFDRDLIGMGIGIESTADTAGSQVAAGPRSPVDTASKPSARLPPGSQLTAP